MGRAAPACAVKVFVAGATGVLGRRVVQRLVGRGHRVVGLSRSPSNAELLRQYGVEPRTTDLFQREGLRRSCVDCDAVLHLATAIPGRLQSKPKDWAENDRIRSEGTRNLIEAAARNACRLYVQQSVLYVYGDRGGAWVDETAALTGRPPAVVRSAVEAERLVQEAVTRRGLPAIVLRFGSFYGGDTHSGELLERVRTNRSAVVGHGGQYSNWVAADDAADAVVRAVERHQGNVGQAFNVCDGHPVTQRDLADYLAGALGAARPRNLPAWLARWLIGRHVVEILALSLRASSRKARERLGWKPVHPTYREGFRAEIQRWLDAHGSSRPATPA